MRKYLAFAASAFQTRLVYRTEVWATIFGELIIILVKIAIWTAVYAGAESVAGVTLPQMITYAIISNSLFAAWDNRELLYGIGDSIRTGDVAVFLLKPLRYPLYLFAVETGKMLFMLLAVVLPTTLIIGLFYGMQPPASAFHAVFFVLYWAQSFVLLFLLSALCGLLAFWLMTSFSLDWIFRAFMQLLSGMFVPLWFFPPGFADVAQHLPFAWIGYYPTAVYLGKLDAADTVLYFGYGMLWTLAAAAVVAALWSRASGRLVVQGG